MILEHDGYFIKKLPDNILEKFEDVLKLDHLDPFSHYYNQQIESHKNINEHIIKYYNDFSKQIELNETGSYLRGAYSYIIKPLAAKKLIDRVYEKGYLRTADRQFYLEREAPQRTRGKVGCAMWWLRRSVL
jgi:hypothetical protein